MVKINNLHSNESSQNDSAPPAFYEHTVYEEPNHIGRYRRACAYVGTLEQITNHRKRTANSLMREAILPQQRHEGFGFAPELLGKTNFPRRRVYTLKKRGYDQPTVFDGYLLSAGSEYWIHYLNNGMLIPKETWEDDILQHYSSLSPTG